MDGSGPPWTLTRKTMTRFNPPFLFRNSTRPLTLLEQSGFAPGEVAKQLNNLVLS